MLKHFLIENFQFSLKIYIGKIEGKAAFIGGNSWLCVSQREMNEKYVYGREHLHSMIGNIVYTYILSKSLRLLRQISVKPR